MELLGKVLLVLEPRTGISKSTGNPWMSQDYVIETVNESFPRKMAFTVFGEDKIKQFGIKVGEVINVFFDINGREYNGRWYNDVRAWRVDRPASPAAAPVATGPVAQAPVPPTGGSAPIASAAGFSAQPDPLNDLPF